MILALTAAVIALVPATNAQTSQSAAPAASSAQKPATPGAANSAFKDDKEKASYAIGTDVGGSVSKSLKRSEIEFDQEMLIKGFKDALTDSKLLLTDEEIKTVLTQLQIETKAKMEIKAKAVAEQSKKEGEAFLAENKTKEGVVTLPDGLQYKVLKQGDGPKPTESDTVECNYRGTLINGKEFDSSYKRNQTASFAVTRVIKAWTEILQLMPVGSKYQIFVPSDLAYGARGAGADIPPNATLIFEIELMGIKAKTEAAKPATPATPAKPATTAKPAATPAK
jgi:FKBP-type peptidyl-prolyl cis-trans isomerase